MSETRKARVIAIANQKGGVAKTTTTRALSTGIAQLGKKVLMIDFDPQSNLTSASRRKPLDEFGAPIPLPKLEKSIVDIIDVIIEKTIAPDDEIPVDFSEYIQNVEENLDVLPTTSELTAVETDMLSMQVGAQMILKTIINSLAANYDYIIIDCQPSLGILTTNSFVACNQVLVPMEADDFSLEGVEQLANSMKLVKRYGYNSMIKFSGILFTKFDNRTTESKYMVEEVKKKIPELQDFFGGKVKVFDTKIPFGTKVKEANRYGISIFEHDPKGKPSLAYKELALEVVNEK